MSVISLKEMWIGITLPPHLFVNQVDTDQPRNRYGSVINVPTALMSPGKARIAKKALDIALPIVDGPYGPITEGQNNPKYIRADQAFRRVTGGTTIGQVIDLSKQMLFSCR